VLPNVTVPLRTAYYLERRHSTELRDVAPPSRICVANSRYVVYLMDISDVCFIGIVFLSEVLW
jgi:hypothetical protein